MRKFCPGILCLGLVSRYISRPTLGLTQVPAALPRGCSNKQIETKCNELPSEKNEGNWINLNARKKS
jgi:hypothetical protein